MTRSRFVSFVFAVLLLSVAALPAQAQQQAAWTQSVGQQLATQLNQPDAEAQNHAMQTIVTLSARFERRALNLDATADPLLRIYANAPDINQRLMAVAALDRVDRPQANLRLLQLGMNETDPRVQRAILYAVANSSAPVSPAIADAFNELRASSGSAITLADGQQ